MREFRQHVVPEGVKLKRAEISPVFGDANFWFFAALAFTTDGFAGANMRLRHVFDDSTIGTKFPFVKRWKTAKQICQRSVGVRFVERVPEINAIFESGDKLRGKIHERRDRGRIEPAARRAYPGRIGKMMQHHHRRDVGGLEAIEQMDVAVQLLL